MKAGSLNINVVKNSDFKYTLDPNRKAWVRHIFPIGQYLIPLIQAIPWQSYRWEGIIPAWISTDSGNAKKVFEKSKKQYTTLIDEDHLIVNLNTVASTSSNLYYRFFGGCVYEILKTEYKNINIREYIDPTGDIDILLSMPYLNWVDDEAAIKLGDNYDFDEYYFTESVASQKSMNALLNDYTQWIFNCMKSQLEKIPQTVFENMFVDSVPFDLADDPEGAYSDLIFERGNIRLVRTFSLGEAGRGGMIKIQLIAKFNDMTKSDHIVEFVLPLTQAINDTQGSMLGGENKSFFGKTTLLSGGFPVETYSELLKGNIDAAITRVVALNSPTPDLYHKFFNHIGRLKYLNIIIPIFVKGLLAKPMTTVIRTMLYNIFYQVERLGYFVLKADAENNLCRFVYHQGVLCDKRKIANDLLGNYLEFLPYILKNILPQSLSIYIDGDNEPLAQTYSLQLQKKFDGSKSYIFSIKEINKGVQELTAMAAGGRRKKKSRKNRTHRRTTRKN